MGVDVDPPRRDERAIGIDLAVPGVVDLTDGDDLTAVDGDVGGDGGGPGAVGDAAATNHEIMHAHIVSEVRATATMGWCS